MHVPQSRRIFSHPLGTWPRRILHCQTLPKWLKFHARQGSEPETCLARINPISTALPMKTSSNELTIRSEPNLTHSFSCPLALHGDMHFVVNLTERRIETGIPIPFRLRLFSRPSIASLGNSQLPGPFTISKTKAKRGSQLPAAVYFPRCSRPIRTPAIPSSPWF